MKKALFASLALACCLLFACASCEETRRGDFIYVPAAAPAENAGAFSLRLEGRGLTDEGLETTVPCLAGAEFGVYVISGEGELTPWADPLYPYEPMRLRTEETPLRFSLPSGIDFYLREERAPAGYLFDASELIPVAPGETVAVNEMEGELRLQVSDTQGRPLAGVPILASAEGGEETLLLTDETGGAALPVRERRTLTVREGALPEHVHPALYVLQDDERIDGGAATLGVRPAERRTLEWIHPSEGTVELAMKIASLSPSGETELAPLPGVTMEIAGTGDALTTDETGSASLSILEGTYSVSFRYDGPRDAALPVQNGQMIVEGGSLTLIELTAAEQKGRVAVSAGAAGAGGRFLLRRAGTDEAFGPYALDEAGQAVSDGLAPGDYTLWLETPEGTVLRSLQIGGTTAQETEGAPLQVTAGALCRAEAGLAVMTTERVRLTARRIDDAGEYAEEAIGRALSLTLAGEAGEAVGTVQAEGGAAGLTALGGRYRLRMEEKEAEQLGVLPESLPFAFPEETEAVFVCETGRLTVRARDREDAPVPYAQLTVRDSLGGVFSLACDASGSAVTPPLAPGQTTIETEKAPEGYAAGPAVTVQLQSGESCEAVCLLAREGRQTLLVRLQSLDDRANAMLTPVEGARVRILRDENGRAGSEVGTFMTDADGSVTVRLPAGGYLAVLEDAGEALPGDPAAFTSENDEDGTALLFAYDTTGGVRLRYGDGTLAQEQLARAHFRLTAPDGEVTELAADGNVFTASGLPAGSYTLTQTQAPDGYMPARTREIAVSGGEALELTIPLAEFARLSVSKVGLTFNDELQAFVVPLSGEYAVYTMEDGALAPYPSAGRQAVVWANVSGEDEERPASILLPADAEGTVYYLKETGKAAGFVVDAEAHEIVLRAGGTARPEYSVASDRGFVTLDACDGKTGLHLPGGLYTLRDGEGNIVLDFVMGEAPYRNPMAIPVGTYTLRAEQAPAGYALPEQPERPVTVESYLSGTGGGTAFRMDFAKIPSDGDLESAALQLWMEEQQGLTVIGLDAEGAVGCPLLEPRIEVDLNASVRADIDSLTLSGASDEEGGHYRARVEYALRNGGWQPGRAEETDVLDAPVTLSFAGVQDDIRAVRITYLSAERGEEASGKGFRPGEIALSVRTEGEGETGLTVRAGLSGLFCYRTEPEGPRTVVSLSSAQEEKFAVQGSDAFAAESGGRDGSISGIAFLDANADGVLSPDESGRLAGLSVRLTDEADNLVDVQKTAGDGRYAFSGVPFGRYRLQFEAGSVIIFSEDSLGSEHVSSRVRDARYGYTDWFVLDGDHTDYVFQAGCLYASEVGGRIFAREGETTEGLGGIVIELERLDDDEEEPVLVSTDDSGAYAFGDLRPGAYRLKAACPEGYLWEDAAQAEGISFSVQQGETHDAGTIMFLSGASVSGRVWLDKPETGFAGVPVALLSVRDGSTAPAGEAETGEDGTYAFTGLRPGEYSVQVELPEGKAFVPYGEDSGVFGAAGRVGSTPPFGLLPGEDALKNAGAITSVKLDVTVFCDTQADGRLSPNEKGLPGATVILIRREDGLDGGRISAVTDGDGRVSFGSLTPGTYVLAYEMPGQWRPVGPKTPGDGRYPESIAVTSAARTGRSREFELTSGMDDMRAVGAALTGSVSGCVYDDANANAVRDGEEAGLAGVPVELISQDGGVVAETATLEDGTYTLEGLASGRYSVRFTLPDGRGFVSTQRSLYAYGAQAAAENVSQTRMFSLSSGANLQEVNASAVRLVRLGGAVWEDRNADARREGAEGALPGLTVELMNASGRIPLQKAETDEAGRYAFDHVMPGSYQLRIGMPDGYVFGADTGAPRVRDARQGRGCTETFSVRSGDVLEDLDYGLYVQGRIAGRVWQDADYDGLAGAQEQGLRGLTAELLDETGAAVQTVRTDRLGDFAFGKLMPGEYSLRITLESGYVFTKAGGDSIMPRSDEREQTVALGRLGMGESRENLMIGALKPAVLSGVAWYDSNDDGRRQPGEPLLSGVEAALAVVRGTDEGLGKETVTAEDGSYRFEGVMPGEAELSFTLADGQAFARNAAGRSRVSVVPQKDARTASVTVTVQAGADRTDLDVGAVGVGIVRGAVWDDTGYDGVRGADEAGVAGAKASLLEASGGTVLAEAESDENGAWEIPFVRAGQYVLQLRLPDGRMFTRGGTVFAETDESAQRTQAFTLAMGEGREGMDAGSILPAEIRGAVRTDSEGVPGVLVSLHEGGTQLRSVQTDEEGAYELRGLRPGAYRLRFALPESELFAEDEWLTPPDPDAAETETDALELHAGDSVDVWTVALVHASSVSGRAWSDLNADGAGGAQEPMLPGVTVSLLNGAGEPVRTLVTDESGSYRFTRLRAGTYALRFTLPDGELFADRTGLPGGSLVEPPEENTGTSDEFGLTEGERRTEMNVGAIRPGEIGDTVWLDGNGNGLQDYREPLLADVSLTLVKLSEDGEIQQSTEVFSDGYGYYHFRNLRPGRYRLRLNADAGDEPTAMHAFGLNEIDSDVDPATMESEVFRLQSGERLLNVDVGLTRHGN